MASQAAHPPLRAVLRKQAAAPQQADTSAAPERLRAEQDGLQAQPYVPPAGADPHTLLDADSWSMNPAAVAWQLSGSNPDFAVVGVLGAQGLGKSSLLNRLLGLDSGSESPGFPLARPAAASLLPPLQHCTHGIQLRASPDRLIGLDTQPLFSASVLEEMSSGGWQQPPPALAAPAVAAAGDAKAPAVPFEGVQTLAELQLAVFLLTACHRLLVLCDGEEDRRTWELLLAAEMLARGVPDPSLPPQGTAGPAGTAGAAAGSTGGGQHLHSQQSAAAAAAQQQAAAAAARGRQAPPAAEHLAEVVLVHVQRPGGIGGSQPPTAAQLEALEARLAAFFGSSRLCQPGPLRMRDHLPGSTSGSWHAGGAGSGASQESSMDSAASHAAVGYWVLPAPCGGAAWGEQVDVLVAALLARPCPPSARRCSELGWLRGAAGDVWRGVRKSADIAAFYSRLARTQLKGAGGWGLAR
ncbi:hypothetical protein ABPG75_004882 [Micractinium tetrahymenae]